MFSPPKSERAKPTHPPIHPPEKPIAAHFQLGRQTDPLEEADQTPPHPPTLSPLPANRINLQTSLAPKSIKLLFSANVRRKLQPQLPAGFYGNAFVLACAESTVDELTELPLSYAVQLLQKAKARLLDDYVRSVIDYLADKSVRPDMVASLVTSQWSRMELMDVDFGWGKPLHVGPLASDIYCLLLPSSSPSTAALDVLIDEPGCAPQSSRRNFRSC
ncbi:alcohol acyltransferase 9-like [Cryptomeria japonica]|uniref:alcohol acyltransferase 9-like n=1 Tax=Cryptomeria japonica TaxID=3369 RepID=UPI0027DA6870|nr:alcohol acyltransferase 9-like [Cryptomeria japonica]